jgi:hypothetical protein
VTVSYSLSPRTQFGVSTTGSKTLSRLEDAYTSTGTVQLGRRMSTRWALGLHAGAGLVTSRRIVYAPPSKPQGLVGGSVALKAASHSILFSADRSIADEYGLGAGSTSSTTAAWSWGRPNRGWTITASGGLQQFHVVGFQTITGWHGNVGFSQVLAKGLALNVAYAYLQNGRNLAGLPGNWSTNGLRLALVWTP